MCSYTTKITTTTSTVLAIFLGVGLLAGPVNQNATANETETETSPQGRQLDTTTRPKLPPCPVDLDGDRVIGFGDVLCVICAWGPCPTGSCPEDLNGNGQVGSDDLFRVLCGFGLTCEAMSG